MAERPKGFTCETCDAFHVFGVYVAAHWDIVLTHTCAYCGAQHSVLRGTAKLIKRGKKPNA